MEGTYLVYTQAGLKTLELRVTILFSQQDTSNHIGFV